MPIKIKRFETDEDVKDIETFIRGKQLVNVVVTDKYTDIYYKVVEPIVIKNDPRLNNKVIVGLFC